VSHDLRTPLAGIKASLSTLADDTIDLVPVDQRALIESATEAADRLDALLSNLLDLSRLQTGSVRPMMESVALDEVLQQALRGVPDSSVVDETEETFPLLNTDAGLLERALANVVENAVRHSPAATPVRISAAVVPDGLAQIRIIDRGPGVPEADRVRMFLPFQRLGDAPGGAGIGLGLAVARGLTEAVGGRIDAEDTPGRGLTMVISVPLALEGTPLDGATRISPRPVT
jgi:two-component system sensor histidine kinase KdpD